MSDSELLFNLFYLLMCICIIFPPTEFISMGISVPQIFENYLGSENNQFINYHQKLSALTLAIHGSLPALYFLIHSIQFPQYNEPNNEEINEFQKMTWKIAQRFSISVVLFIGALLTYWYQHDWKYHPISQSLLKFSNSTQGYQPVAINIADEFRRPDVLNLKINSISSVIATENWIIKTSPYFMYFAHQSDTTLIVNKTDTFNIAQDTADSLQMINIVVKPTRQNVHEFQIRINALDFKTLQDRISRPITIPPTVQFHQNITDRFIEVFKNHISLNHKYQTNQTLETCFACMIAIPNIKIHKQCLDVDANDQPIPNERRCRDCFCRPMWCVDCLARWFASRQSEFDHDVWLEQKCTCPLCRASFCILDVCYLDDMSSSRTE